MLINYAKIEKEISYEQILWTEFLKLLIITSFKLLSY